MKPEEREKFEYELKEPLPRSWDSRPKALPSGTEADREAFLALDQMELH